MSFVSVEFLCFFVFVTTGYFLLPHRQRWWFLLTASCYFYMRFVPVYILILFFTIGVDYLAGIFIEQTEGRKRRLYLILSIFANVCVLAVFKYFNFFNHNFAALFAWLGWHYPVQDLSIILPIGLSFHTFQSLSYTIEVYYRRQKAERHLGLFALYVMFYPQLVAGPIERPQNLLDQFRVIHYPVASRMIAGLQLMLWGFFKKLVIAERMAIIANNVYNQPNDFTGVPLWVATYAFAFQIYCDFSGYTDIARGAARVLGFELMQNFAQPYYSQSIGEFWRRWHISLSTWFRDYLYIPLGGNRVAAWRWYCNLMIVFLVSGLWHGANWTFVIWGGLHGVYQILSLWISSKQSASQQPSRWQAWQAAHPWLTRVFNTLLTFHLVCFAWIFFRANTLQDAWHIISHLFAGIEIRGGYGIGVGGVYELILAACAIVLMESVHLLQLNGRLRTLFQWQPAWVRIGVYYGLAFSILLFGIFDISPFIYFQF